MKGAVSPEVVAMAKQTEAERKVKGQPSAETLARLEGMGAVQNTLNGEKPTPTPTKTKRQTRTSRVRTIVEPTNNGREETKVATPTKATPTKAESKTKTKAKGNGNGNGKSPTSEAARFNEAAKVAEAELKGLDKAAVKLVADWWARNFMTAGHKRLGRALVAQAKNGKK